MRIWVKHMLHIYKIILLMTLSSPSLRLEELDAELLQKSI